MADDVQRNLAARIAGLTHSTPATRRAVYEELRAALKEEIRAAAPFMPVQTVVGKRRELENAIIAVERVAAQSDPPPEPVVRHASPPQVTEIVAETPPPPPEVNVEEEPYRPEPEEVEPVRPATHSSGAAVEVVPFARYLVEIPENATLPIQPQPAEPRTARPPPVRHERESVQPMDEEAGQVAEFAPQAESEVEQRSSRPLAVYIAAAAMAIGVSVILFVMFAGGGDQPVKQVAKNRVTPVATDTQLAIRPSDVPPTPPAAAEIFRSTGFAPAAQSALREADALLARGDYERAIAAYDDAIRFDPTQATAFGNRAFAHWSRGNAAAAVRDYGAALQIQPANVSFRLNRAVGYNRLGEYERAIIDLNEVIRAEPANFDALSSRCWAQALHNHLKEALADCNEALKLRPKDANALDSRGLVQLKLGRLDRALADYTAALRIDPKLVSSLYGRGLAKIGRGDRAGGNEDVAAAKAMMPEIQAAFARYGVH